MANTQPRFKRRSILKYSGVSMTAGLAGCLGGEGDNSDEYPSDSITDIIPFSEGGGTDTFHQPLMPIFSDELGVNIEIEHIPGGGSLRGTAQAYEAEPDGYTIVGFNPPSTPATWLMNEPELDWDITEFEGIGYMGGAPYILVVHEDINAESYSDVMDLYSSGELSNLGGQAVGSVTHLAAEIMKSVHGFEYGQYVGYEGSGPLAQAVSSGEVPAGIVTQSNALAIRDNTTPILNLASEAPPAGLTDLDTTADAGVEPIDYIATVRMSLFAPPETPQERREVLESALENAVKSDEYQQWGEDSNNVVLFGGIDEAKNQLVDSVEEIRANVDVERIRNEIS